MRVLTPLTLVSVLTFPTFIQANADPSNNGFSVIVDVGIADIAVNAEGNYQEESDTTTSPALGLSYQFNDNISVIAQYTDYGTANLFSATVYANTTAIDFNVASETKTISVVGQYLIALEPQGWSLGARLGLTSWDTEFSVVSSSNQASFNEKIADDSGIAITGGVVAEYAFTEQFALTFSADWFVNKIDQSIEFTDDGADLDMQFSRYAMGLKYKF